MLAKADSPSRMLRAWQHASAPTSPAHDSGKTSQQRRCLRDDRGFGLIEVIVAAALVAIIAIGTLTGLEGATATTTANRLHNEAAVLAAQSQETMRSEPTETLESLAKETEEVPSKPYVATKTIENESFTITQKVEEVNGASGVTGCTASSKEGESSHPGGYYFRVSSQVIWPQLRSTQEPVKQASIITPRTGSVLEVTVDTAASTPEPVSGATVIANGVTTTTGVSGCVIFPFIKATTTPLTVEKAGYVTPNGASKFSASEIAIAPDITTQYQVTLSPAGTIKAIFTYKGEETYKGVSVVESDTFVAANSELTTGSTTAGTASQYAHTVETSDTLAPFSTNWVVYGGDCTADNSEIASKGEVKNATAKVTGGSTTEVRVPLSHVELNVYEGTKTSASRPTTGFPVTITDPLCAKLAPTDVHTQTTTTPSTSETKAPGHLPYPFQPFGKFALCLYDASLKKTYTVPYENKTEAGTTVTIYLGESTATGMEIKTNQTSC